MMLVIMLPVLLQLGPIRIYSMGVMMLLALISGMYWWWKMGRDENWQEISLFDLYFLAVAAFFVTGRLGYVVMHYGEMGGLLGSLSLLSRPGIDYHTGLVGGVLVASKFAQYREWEMWKVWDSMVVSISLMMIWGSVGMLLNRGQMPADIALVVWSILSFGVVTVVRKNFRFYSWYKGEGSVARDGLAALVWVGMTGVYHLGVSVVYGHWWIAGGSILSVLAVVVVVMNRAGKINLSGVQWDKIIRPRRISQRLKKPKRKKK